MFGIEHPLLLAPMAGAAGGRLAKAVSDAGGLGMVAAGYGGVAGLQRELDLTRGTSVGIGFITWRLASDIAVLEAALAHRPAAVWLSYADPAAHIPAIHAAETRVICQVQTLGHARDALAAGADVLVAQGSEAGGHGGDARSTFTLVPEVADLAAGTGVPVLAAGGIADGRGLAAALALGADGAVLGSRFVASAESLVSDAERGLVLAADGDSTIRTRVYDVARELDWPTEYTGRLINNEFIGAWHGREDTLAAEINQLRSRFTDAVARSDFSIASVHIGEAVGLIHDVRPAADIVRDIVAEADQALRGVAASTR
ncbi:NAD(P)H-dependent flavin oxidoreductase [Mycolicibacter arupensis]|uniref:NAD(P)H-dependent flavin oxidoreductase n=1 Tax=Mycolicibacter arupensis TaxID=342002 RepID=UPI003B3B4757